MSIHHFCRTALYAALALNAGWQALKAYRRGEHEAGQLHAAHAVIYAALAVVDAI